MTYLLRLDVERIRLNLANTTSLVEDDDLLRKLSARGVWRHNDQWWGATEAAIRNFEEGEIIERRLAGDDAPGVS